MVLTGGKMRIEKGMEILQKGFAEKMFISGVFMPSEIEMKFNSEKSKKKIYWTVALILVLKQKILLKMLLKQING